MRIQKGIFARNGHCGHFAYFGHYIVVDDARSEWLDMPRGMKQHALTALGRRNAPAHPANAGFKDGVTPMVNFLP